MLTCKRFTHFSQHTSLALVARETWLQRNFRNCSIACIINHFFFLAASRHMKSSFSVKTWWKHNSEREREMSENFVSDECHMLVFYIVVVCCSLSFTTRRLSTFPDDVMTRCSRENTVRQKIQARVCVQCFFNWTAKNCRRSACFLAILQSSLSVQIISCSFKCKLLSITLPMCCRRFSLHDNKQQQQWVKRQKYISDWSETKWAAKKKIYKRQICAAVVDFLSIFIKLYFSLVAYIDETVYVHTAEKKISNTKCLRLRS